MPILSSRVWGLGTSCHGTRLIARGQKSRRQRRNASGEAPGGEHLQRWADLIPPSQELPLSPPAPLSGLLGGIGGPWDTEVGCIPLALGPKPSVWPKEESLSLVSTQRPVQSLGKCRPLGSPNLGQERVWG